MLDAPSHLLKAPSDEKLKVVTLPIGSQLASEAIGVL